MKLCYLINDIFIDELFNKIVDSRIKGLFDLHNHEGYIQLLEQDNKKCLPKLSSEVIKNLIENCFEATLEREENNYNSFGISFEPPETRYVEGQYVFQNPIEFSYSNLKKLSPSIEYTNYQMGVWINESDELYIWGFKDKLVSFLQVNSISPGKIILSCYAGISHSFKCLIGISQTSFINLSSIDYNPLQNWLTPNDILLWHEIERYLFNLLAKMFNNLFGGILLFVQSNETQWKESISKPILYQNISETGYEYMPIADKFGFNSSNDKNKHLEESNYGDFKSQLLHAKANQSIDDIYRLTKVDGATILTEKFNVVSFGAKIEASSFDENILVIEAFSKSIEEKPLAKIGGMRHQSAAKFIYNQRNCIAVAVSEDRKISVFSWNEKKQTVQQLKNFEFLIF